MNEDLVCKNAFKCKKSDLIYNLIVTIFNIEMAWRMVF